ncbi:hypothetical protein Q8F55_006050 [Vanrija albida]|uniref:Peptidase C1A papain C-terminal domain-containing protein n=1 Tax=Vanrija albida TaxID=181172 RepID=A0ABR3Q3W1_9TREE
MSPTPDWNDFKQRLNFWDSVDNWICSVAYESRVGGFMCGRCWSINYHSCIHYTDIRNEDAGQYARYLLATNYDYERRHKHCNAFLEVQMWQNQNFPDGAPITGQMW